MIDTQPTRTNPYVGPSSFQTGETLYGRDRETRDLTGLLIAERIVLLHSPSGAGKTSLVQAALIPRLAEMDFLILPTMRVNQELPGELDWAKMADAAPNRYTLSALLYLEETLPPDQPRLPLADLATLTLGDYLDRRPRPADAPTSEVLIFDQFEEILTIDPNNHAAKTAFFTQLGVALRNRNRWALFAMREDYVASLAPYLRPVPTRLSTTFRLDLLGPAAARLAIREPARRYGVDFDDAAARRLIDDLRRVQVQRPDGSPEEQLGAAIEPVQLQVVCYRLWEQRFNGGATALPAEARRITMADIDAIGNVNQALADYYAAEVAQVAGQTGVSERAIREWFDRQLITTQGIRGQVLQGVEQSQGLPNAAIRQLINAYLVRAEKRRGATWFELAHDRLIAPVLANNAAWFNANLNTLQVQADLWERQGRPAGMLLRDQALRDAEVWAAANDAALTDIERVFLAECREARQIAEREQRAARIIRILGIVAGLVGVVALVLAFLAWMSRNEAVEATNKAVEATNNARARYLAGQAERARETFPQRSLLMSIEAVGIIQADGKPLPGAVSALQSALATTGGEPLIGHQAAITAVAFSPDGRALATGDAEGALRLWDVRDPAAAPTLLPTQSGPISLLAFSPDASVLATGDSSNALLLWDRARLEAAPRRLEGHTAPIVAAAFSPDGRRLATGDADGAAYLWDLTNPAAAPQLLAGHTDSVSSLAFSPDGRLLATGGYDATARIWAIANLDAEPRVLEGHADRIRTLAFSPAGDRIVTAGDDATARVWNLAMPRAEALVLENPAFTITIAVFSPDGSALLTGGDDPIMRLWELGESPPGTAPSAGAQRPPGEQSPPRFADLPHPDRVSAARFTPDGSAIITTNYDGAARLWNRADPNLPPQVLRGHEQDRSIVAAALSPDGRYLATGSSDATARLWSLERIGANPALQGHGKTVKTVAFSPDGRILATGGLDETTRLWSLTDANAAPEVLTGAGDWITALAFNADGSWLLAGGASLQLWDLRDRAAPPRILTGYVGRATHAAFAPDGRFVLAAGDDGAVYRWDLNDAAAPPEQLTPNATDLTAVALRPDGQALATANFASTVQVRDLARPDTPVFERQGPLNGIGILTFGASGNLLAGAGFDSTVWVWDLSRPAADPTVLRGMPRPAAALSFSRDGRYLLAGLYDGSAHLWDRTAAASEATTLLGHTQPIVAVAFSPTGESIVTGSDDGTARLWSLSTQDLIALACKMAGRNLTLDEWRLAYGDGAYRKTCPDLPLSPSLIDTAAERASYNEMSAALDLMHQVRQLGGAAEIPARSWSKLCRQGSLAGHAAAVLDDACEQAVALAPNDGSVYDSRGLARALTNDYAGAVADFQMFVAWASQQQDSRSDQRTEWIAALEAGRNPFDAALIAQLRNEQP